MKIDLCLLIILCLCLDGVSGTPAEPHYFDDQLVDHFGGGNGTTFIQVSRESWT